MRHTSANSEWTYIKKKLAGAFGSDPAGQVTTKGPGEREHLKGGFIGS